MGKSRLVWEFTPLAPHPGLAGAGERLGLLRQGDAVPAGHRPAQGLLAGSRSATIRGAIREKVTGKLLTLDRGAASRSCRRCWRCSTCPSTTPRGKRSTRPAPPADPGRGQAAAAAGEPGQPLLLVFEDLHWIDAETQALLDSLVESLPTARLLLLVNYRPSTSTPGAARPTTRSSGSTRCRRRAPRSCSTRCSGTTATSSRSSALLIERTEGNPFFLEESVRTLVETEVLVGERGAYRLAQAARTHPGAGDGPGGPGGPHRPPAARGQAAASDGRRDRQGRAVRAAPGHRRACPRTTCGAGSRHLQAAEFLYETSLFPELEYTFKHALTHEVAYGSLLQERRRALHARIVEAIETALRRPPDRARRAAGAPRAPGRGVGQGGRATSGRPEPRPSARSANREAVGVFEQALAALAHLPETSRDDGAGRRRSPRAPQRALAPRPLRDRLRAPPRRRARWPPRSAISAGWAGSPRTSASTRGDGARGGCARVRRARLDHRRGLDDLQLAVAANYYLGIGLLRSRGLSPGRRVLLQDSRAARREIDSASAVASRGSRSVMSRFFWAFALAERGEFDRG